MGGFPHIVPSCASVVVLPRCSRLMNVSPCRCSLVWEQKHASIWRRGLRGHAGSSSHRRYQSRPFILAPGLVFPQYPTHTHIYTQRKWQSILFASCLVKCRWIMHFIGWQRRPVRLRIIKQRLGGDASGHPSSARMKKKIIKNTHARSRFMSTRSSFCRHNRTLFRGKNQYSVSERDLKLLRHRGKRCSSSSNRCHRGDSNRLQTKN